tara:strand:+ start:4242 stop:5390 length:1149 start_codon:yes stop_codon:yes gene_type:complete
MFPTRRIATLGGDKFRDEYSLEFDGTDDGIITTLVPNYTNITVASWIKVSDDGSTKPIAVARDSSENGFLFYVSTTESLVIKLGADDGEDAIGVSTSNLKVNVWQHVAFTWNGSILKLYLNGEFATQGTMSGTAGITEKMKIGQDTLNNSAYDFNGKISEVVVYNTAFSLNSIKQIYNSGEPYNHKEGIVGWWALKGWWRMGDGTFDQKSTNDSDGGIVCDMNNVSLGSDVLGGKGDFSDASYWELINNESGTDQVEISSGVTQFKYDGSNDTNGSIRKQGILTAGKMYRIDIDVTANSGCNIYLDEAGPYVKIAPIGETGSFTTYWSPQVTYLRIYRWENSGDNSYDETATIDNVVVREVTGGNHGRMVNMHPDDFTGDTP